MRPEPTIASLHYREGRWMAGVRRGEESVAGPDADTAELALMALVEYLATEFWSLRAQAHAL